MNVTIPERWGEDVFHDSKEFVKFDVPSYFPSEGDPWFELHGHTGSAQAVRVNHNRWKVSVQNLQYYSPRPGSKYTFFQTQKDFGRISTEVKIFDLLRRTKAFKAAQIDFLEKKARKDREWVVGPQDKVQQALVRKVDEESSKLCQPRDCYYRAAECFLQSASRPEKKQVKGKKIGSERHNYYVRLYDLRQKNDLGLDPDVEWGGVAVHKTAFEEVVSLREEKRNWVAADGWLEGVSPEAVSLLVAYFYKGTIDLSNVNYGHIDQLYTVAEKQGFEILKKALEPHVVYFRFYVLKDKTYGFFTTNTEGLEKCEDPGKLQELFNEAMRSLKKRVDAWPVPKKVGTRRGPTDRIPEFWERIDWTNVEGTYSTYCSGGCDPNRIVAVEGNTEIPLSARRQQDYNASHYHHKVYKLYIPLASFPPSCLKGEQGLFLKDKSKPNPPPIECENALVWLRATPRFKAAQVDPLLEVAETGKRAFLEGIDQMYKQALIEGVQAAAEKIHRSRVLDRQAATYFLELNSRPGEIKVSVEGIENQELYEGLYEDLSAEDPTFAPDQSFQFGNETLSVHNETFQTMLSAREKGSTFTLEDVEKLPIEVFKDLRTYFYKGTVVVDKENLDALYQAAEHYNFTQLKEKLEPYMRYYRFYELKNTPLQEPPNIQPTIEAMKKCNEEGQLLKLFHGAMGDLVKCL